MKIACLVCGGRGGWSLNYIDGRIVPCRACDATGEEPHPATRSMLADLAIPAASPVTAEANNERTAEK